MTVFVFQHITKLLLVVIFSVSVCWLHYGLMLSNLQIASKECKPRIVPLCLMDRETKFHKGQNFMDRKAELQNDDNPSCKPCLCNAPDKQNRINTVENQTASMGNTAWEPSEQKVEKLKLRKYTLSKFCLYNKAYLGELVPLENLVDHNRASLSEFARGISPML